MEQLHQKRQRKQATPKCTLSPNPEANHGCISWLELSGENWQLEHHSAKPLVFNSNFHQENNHTTACLFIYLLNLLSDFADIYLKQMLYSLFQAHCFMRHSLFHYRKKILMFWCYSEIWHKSSFRITYSFIFVPFSELCLLSP